MDLPSRTNVLSVNVDVSSDLIAVDIKDFRPGALDAFADLSQHQREQLASEAWSIGLRVISDAQLRAQEACLRDVGSTLLADIDRQLKAHVDSQHQMLAAQLGKFFDPKDGQVTQRLAEFVADEGSLARLLGQYVGPQGSVLAESLARQVGETSPLLKKLNPTDSEGFVKTLEAQLRKVMGEGHDAMLVALDPAAENGAVARFLRRLREELKGAEEDREKQLKACLAALDGNDENSLISRLVRETEQARQAVLSAVNPEAPSSPMAIIKTTLTTLLEAQAKAQSEGFKQQQERQERFEKELRDALTRIETKRSHDQSSPRGGLAFEALVHGFVVDALRNVPCVVDCTGNNVGLVPRSKKGDTVARFTDESAFSGAAAVFESKHEKNYSVKEALAELEDARKNRDAAVGVFVMAKSHASPDFPLFARHGHNVLVTWDENDPSTDPYLHAAIFVGLGLLPRKRTQGDAGDIKALQDIEHIIDREIRRFDDMKKHTESIRRGADKIDEDLRKSRDTFKKLLAKAKQTLTALCVELIDEPAERATPIVASELQRAAE